jgi:hypothetical protein
MIFVTNIFNLPLLIAVWLIEAYIFLAVARLILANVPSGRHTRLYRQVKLLTDLLPDFISRQLAEISKATIPPWVPWAVAILSLCVVRQILVWIVTR